MEKLKCAVIGCGGLGRVHLKNLLTMDQVHVVAVCDTNENQFYQVVKTNLNRTDTLDLTGVKTYTDAQTLLNSEELDFVVIALPTYLHAPYSVMALDKGLHVFCEKPMSVSVEGCRDMVNAAKRSNKLLSIGQILRFTYPYRLIKEAYENGQYGKLLRLDTRRDSHPPIWGSNNWFMDFNRSGGAVIDLHVHDVDYINYLLGVPDALVSDAYHVRSGFDCISTQYFYKDGPIVHASSDWNMPVSHGFQPFTTAVFEKAVISIDKYCFKVYIGDRILEESDFEGNYANADPYYDELTYFIQCIRQGVNNEIVPMESTMQSIEIVMAEIESAKTRTVVQLKK